MHFRIYNFRGRKLHPGFWCCCKIFRKSLGHCSEVCTKVCQDEAASYQLDLFLRIINLVTQSIFALIYILVHLNHHRHGVIIYKLKNGVILHIETENST